MTESPRMTVPGLRWILILAASGLAAGFLGPIVRVPSANQGPLVGIFITGPIGALLGLTGYLLSRLFNITARTQWRSLYGLNAALVGTTLVSVLPGPELNGYVVEGEVTRCRPSPALRDDVVAYWQQRIAEVTWASPTAGWRDQMRQALEYDNGVVIDLRVLHRTEIREHRKPWNKGVRFTIDRTTPNDTASYYDANAAGSCVRYDHGTSLRTFIAYDRSAPIRPPTEWPPTDVAIIIGRSSLDPVPSMYHALLPSRP